MYRCFEPAERSCPLFVHPGHEVTRKWDQFIPCLADQKRAINREFFAKLHAQPDYYLQPKNKGHKTMPWTSHYFMRYSVTLMLSVA